MTWMLFSRSIAPFRSVTWRPPPAADLLADPLHVAIDRDLAHRYDLAALDHDEPRAVGGPMVLVRVGERRRHPPGVELPQGLERVLDRFASEVGAGALDGLDRHDHPQPPTAVRRGVRVVGVVLLVELHQRL